MSDQKEDDTIKGRFEWLTRVTGLKRRLVISGVPKIEKGSKTIDRVRSTRGREPTLIAFRYQHGK